MNEIYLDDARLFAIADAIAAIKPCPFAGRVTRDQIIVALGEHGDVWPLSILPGLIRDSADERLSILQDRDANLHQSKMRACSS